MLELSHAGYYPLTEEQLTRTVPSRAGVYVLAVRLANGVHQTFFVGQSDNLYLSLRRILDAETDAISPIVLEHLSRYRVYFAYFVIPRVEYRMEIEKMLAQTTDPVIKLRLVNAA